MKSSLSLPIPFLVFVLSVVVVGKGPGFFPSGNATYAKNSSTITTTTTQATRKVASLTTTNSPFSIAHSIVPKQSTTLSYTSTTTKKPSTSTSSQPPSSSTSSAPTSTKSVSNETEVPLAVSSTSSPLPPVVVQVVIPEINSVASKLNLYTRRNPVAGHTLLHHVPATVELADNYQSGKPTRVIIHGSFDGLDFGHWMRDMKQRILDIEDSNVIIADWSSAASANTAQNRINNARIVGHQLTVLLKNFIGLRGMTPEEIHIIAHGDGTFAADVIGRNIQGLGRISGLNPSGPAIDALPNDEKLDRSDALFVDIIHTDEQNSTLSLYKRGTRQTMGDVDFYPNGGESQPGCSLDDLEDLIKKAISEGLRTFLSCSHYRAIDYYLESITDDEKCLHLAYECNSYEDFKKGVCGHCNDDKHLCSEMGFRSDRYYHHSGLKVKRDNGVKLFYDTSKKRPFCLYHYNVQVNIAAEPSQVRGGMIRMRIDGQKESIEVKLYGGTNSFKAGYTTGLIATHYNDIGLILGVGINWLPNSFVTLLYGENLYIEDIRITQIGWDSKNSKTSNEITTLCPTKRTGQVTPFYGETYFFKSDNCTYNFRY